GAPHDYRPPAADAARRWARDRQAWATAAAALGPRLRRPRGDIRGRRGARRGLPLRRLLARARAGLCRPRRRRDWGSTAGALPQLAQAATRAARDRAPPQRGAAEGGGAEMEAAGARGPRAGEAAVMATASARPPRSRPARRRAS